MNKNEDELKRLFDNFNRDQLSERLRPHEVDEVRELLPQIRDMMEGQRRVKWLLKSISMFLLAAPALMAMWQIWSKLVEWIRGQ